MEPLDQYLKRRKKENGYLFIPYIALGDPDWELSEKFVDLFIKCGADTIELGLPFTDPAADGPVLQRAFQRVLSRSFKMEELFLFLTRLKKKYPDYPFLIMGYANLFYHAGFETIFKKLIQGNVAGVIIPDVPYEEKRKIIKENRLEHIMKQIAWVDFITPTTTLDRLDAICSDAGGFLYFVSTKGVTGQQSTFSLASSKTIIKEVRKRTAVPLMIGFGVRNRENAKESVKYGDGFIVGSRFHEIIEQNMEMGLDTFTMQSAVSSEKVISSVKTFLDELLPEKKLAV